MTYVGCATSLYGDVAQADIIKLHKSSGKVTFLLYENFARDELPVLRQRNKVSLRTRWVQVFDHLSERQLLYSKERYLVSDHDTPPTTVVPWMGTLLEQRRKSE